MKLIAVFVQNQPGQTARITKILSDAGVNICWVTIANSGSFGVMKFLVDQCEVAANSLRQAGLMVSLLEVLAVEVPNQVCAAGRRGFSWKESSEPGQLLRFCGKRSRYSNRRSP